MVGLVLLLLIIITLLCSVLVMRWV
uniref:Uncharacterized protein n=1 Tax=Rhizophora mucronata TaxID=61149 RepID=A0A2P2QRR8_RHIMU